ncbi:hypothetical protein [Comamonas sp.]|uniref:hypothetical protein n=1 Tax=Comamonas sp. TaxID=34028 RepID=UPI00289F4559|nr:hypothetical protein [Comamonas sp.]
MAFTSAVTWLLLPASRNNVCAASHCACATVPKRDLLASLPEGKTCPCNHAKPLACATPSARAAVTPATINSSSNSHIDKRLPNARKKCFPSGTIVVTIHLSYL